LNERREFVVSDYPKAPFGEPAEFTMRECGRCEELQKRLAAAETEVARLGRCNDQLSRTHAEIINSQNANLAAAEARLTEFNLQAAEQVKCEVEHTRVTRMQREVMAMRLKAVEAEIAFLEDLNDQLYKSKTAANQKCEIAEGKLAAAEEKYERLRVLGDVITGAVDDAVADLQAKLAAAEARLTRGLPAGCVLCKTHLVGHSPYGCPQCLAAEVTTLQESLAAAEARVLEPTLAHQTTLRELDVARALLREACEACKSDDDIEDWYPSLLEDEWFAKAKAAGGE
jgi:DNA repair exonuclease SbcCD ATPase subunit